tara:strand:+ start:2835 stop:3089 length:255 start_codon:yes stop_codon:yes gene_type:complete
MSAEIFVIVAAAILLFGADKIPEFARTFGKAINNVRNATSEIKNEIKNSSKELQDVDVSKKVKSEINKAKKDIESVSDSVKREL